MNLAEAQATINSLESMEAENFAMDDFYNYAIDKDCNICNTTCCIAGDIALRHCGHDAIAAPLFPFFDYARTKLEISIDEAKWLFCGGFSKKYMEKITIEEAIAAIRWLMDGKDPKEFPKD